MDTLGEVGTGACLTCLMGWQGFDWGATAGVRQEVSGSKIEPPVGQLPILTIFFTISRNLPFFSVEKNATELPLFITQLLKAWGLSFWGGGDFATTAWYICFQVFLSCTFMVMWSFCLDTYCILWHIYIRSAVNSSSFDIGPVHMSC